MSKRLGFVGVTIVMSLLVGYLALSGLGDRTDNPWVIEPAAAEGEWVKFDGSTWELGAPVPTTLCQTGSVSPGKAFRVRGHWLWLTQADETEAGVATLRVTVFSKSGKEIHRVHQPMTRSQSTRLSSGRLVAAGEPRSRKPKLKKPLQLPDGNVLEKAKETTFTDPDDIALWVPPLEDADTYKLCIDRSVVSPGVLRIINAEVVDRKESLELAHHNILLVIVDTLRVDALGLYSPELTSSPNIDAFAKDGFVYDHAWAQSTWTLPSTLSFLFSAFPRTLDYAPMWQAGHLAPTTVQDSQKLSDVFVSLPEVLNSVGYTTHKYFSNPLLRSLPRARSGFDVYQFFSAGAGHIKKLQDRTGAKKKSATQSGVRAADRRIVDKALDEIGRWAEDGRPNFLYLHFMGPHAPNKPTKEARRAVGRTHDIGVKRGNLTPKMSKKSSGRRYQQEDSQGYLGAMWDLDKDLQRLFSQLETTGLMESTIIVIASDHGEMMGEYGISGHGKDSAVYHPVTHVPLIVRVPGQLPGRDTETLVGLVNIAPTVLDGAGLAQEIPDLWQGQSMLKGADQGVVAVQRETEIAFSGGSEHKVMVDGDTQEILGYYDLSQPNPEGKLLPPTGVPQGLSEQITSWFENTIPVKATRPDASNVSTTELTESLRALGYLE